MKRLGELLVQDRSRYISRIKLQVVPLVGLQA